MADSDVLSLGGECLLDGSCVVGFVACCEEDDGLVVLCYLVVGLAEVGASVVGSNVCA